MNLIPTIAILCMLASAVVQIVRLFGNQENKDLVSPVLLGVASVLLLAVSTERSIRIGFPALTGTFESLVFYSALICILLVFYRFQKRAAFFPGIQFGATFIAIVLLAVANSPIAPKDALAPIPALRSGWLVAHVALSFVGEAFFVAGFVASLLYIFSKNEEKKLAYDRITYTSIAVGYPVFTAGALIFGAIWAEQAWGAWWSWDPKETWALVTWLVYTFYLHVRFMKRKTGLVPAWVSVIGFLCTLFTFFGVNFLLSGLHSYA